MAGGQEGPLALACCQLVHSLFWHRDRCVDWGQIFFYGSNQLMTMSRINLKFYVKTQHGKATPCGLFMQFILDLQKNTMKAGSLFLSSSDQGFSNGAVYQVGLSLVFVIYESANPHMGTSALPW